LSGISGMKLRILGTGTSIPSLRRASSSYLVSGPAYRILVDAGPSAVRRLLEFGTTVDDIDAVILTHFHVDHTADLSTFLFACNYGQAPRVKPLLLLGGQGMHRFYRGLLRIYPWVAPKSYELTVESMTGGQRGAGDFRIETCRVNHNRESIGVKISGPRNLVFTGDTDYSRNLVRLAERADLLVAECSFPERKVKGHLNLAALERIVRAAQPRRVIISHLYPEWEAFHGILHEPYLMGEDGLEIKL
jgi:ribonuclease BN (tRNA processing enzyme)